MQFSFGLFFLQEGHEFFCLNTLVAVSLFREDKIEGMCSALEAEGDRDSGVPYFL